MEIQRIKISEVERELVSGFMGEPCPKEIDFNWLMPVVEKIRSLRDTTLTDKTNGLAYSTISISFEANGHALGGDKNKYRASLLGALVYQRMINSFQHTFDKVNVPHITTQGENPIQTLYDAIIQFITWYNSITK